VGDWLDTSFRPIMLYPDEWNIPYTQNKLYGKQQFERLLSQFRAISEHTGTLLSDAVRRGKVLIAFNAHAHARTQRWGW
jgi:hypothetical protein